MSTDFWWGFLLGAIATIITGFALCALLVLILYRWIWIPNAEIEARGWTGDLGTLDEDEIEHFLNDPGRPHG